MVDCTTTEKSKWNPPPIEATAFKARGILLLFILYSAKFVFKIYLK